MCIHSLHTPGQGAHSSATMPVGCIQPALQAMGELRAALGCCSKQRLHAHKEVRPEEVVKPRTKGWGGCLCPCSLSTALGGRTCPAAPLTSPGSTAAQRPHSSLCVAIRAGHTASLCPTFSSFLVGGAWKCHLTSARVAKGAGQLCRHGQEVDEQAPGVLVVTVPQGLPCPGDVSSSQQGKRKQILYILRGG